MDNMVVGLSSVLGEQNLDEYYWKHLCSPNFFKPEQLLGKEPWSLNNKNPNIRLLSWSHWLSRTETQCTKLPLPRWWHHPNRCLFCLLRSSFCRPFFCPLANTALQKQTWKHQFCQEANMEQFLQKAVKRVKYTVCWKSSLDLLIQCLCISWYQGDFGSFYSAVIDILHDALYWGLWICHLLIEYFAPSLVLHTDLEILFGLQHCEC